MCLIHTLYVGYMSTFPKSTSTDRRSRELLTHTDTNDPKLSFISFIFNAKVHLQCLKKKKKKGSIQIFAQINVKLFCLTWERVA